MISIYTEQNLKDPFKCDNITRIDVDSAGAKFSISVLHNSPFLFMESDSASFPLQFVHIDVIKKGFCKLQFNGTEYICNAGDLLLVNWGAMMAKASFSEDIVLERITIRIEYLKTIFRTSLPKLFLLPGEIFVLHLSKVHLEIWQNYFALLHTLVSYEAMDIKVLDTLFLSTMQFVNHFYKSKREVVRRYRPHKKRLTESFIRLVSKYAKEEHEITFYARCLCVTPHYLSVIIKSETGETAREWIDKSITISIQVALTSTNEPLKKLSDAFCFSSSSAFCKFFKRRTGLTPNEYRNKKK